MKNFDERRKRNKENGISQSQVTLICEERMGKGAITESAHSAYCCLEEAIFFWLPKIMDSLLLLLKFID